MDDAKVLVRIRRINGQELELEAGLDDTIGELKARLAELSWVPTLCQKLVLESPVSEDFGQKLAGILRREGTEIINKLDRNYLYELMAIHRPHRHMYQCLTAVFCLITSCPSVRSSIRLPRSIQDPGWDNLRALMCVETREFLRGLQEFPEEVVQANMRETHVLRAEALALEMGETFTPGHQAKFSVACGILCEWALISLQFFRAFHSTSWAVSQSLQDRFPLSLYSDGQQPLQLSLLTDVEPAFASLSSDVEHVLVAIKALAQLGDKCLDRSVPALAGKLRDSRQEIRKAACDALKQLFCHDSDTASGLREQLETCTPHGSNDVPWHAAVEIMEVLVHMAAGHLHTLSWLVGAMCFAADEAKEAGWSHFQEVEHLADSEKVAGLLVAFMQVERAAQGRMCDALVKVGKRDEAAVINLLLEELVPAKVPFQRARATAVLVRVAPCEHEAAVKAMTHELHASEGEHLLLISDHLASLSPASRPEILRGLFGELKRRGGADCQAVIQRMATYSETVDDRLVSVVWRYLKNSHSFQSHEWPAAVMMAVSVVGPAANAGIPRAQEAVRLAAKALCKKMVSGCEVCKTPLLQLIAEYDLPDDLQVDLLNGLRLGKPATQTGCQTVLKELLKGKDVGPLLDFIDNEIQVTTRCAAVELLPYVSQRGQADVTAMLLKLAADEDVVLKSTAIGVLGQCAAFNTKICEDLRRQLTHQDAYVRLASLQSLKNLEQDKDSLLDSLSHSLKDPASIVVHGALKCLGDLLEGREAQVCQLAGPFTNHGDAMIREEAVTLLGKMTHEGRPAALNALTVQGQTWPETDPGVKKAWDEALQALTA